MVLVVPGRHGDHVVVGDGPPGRCLWQELREGRLLRLEAQWSP